MRRLRTLVFSAICCAALSAANTVNAQNNPVIDNVPDVGVINFNGKYYLAGVNTNGGFYISNDLVNWQGPTHVFTMNNDWTKGQPFGDNQIHAADIVYRNGKFHFYWSVNYWGTKYTTVHAGHAVADNILGPYVEPNKKRWFDDRIDPDLFIDSDSSHYFYIVKFTDGNTIWGQRLSDPWTHKGQPKRLINSLPDTWERLDNNVMEGPEVIKYRSKYYMMYNGNHTGQTYGNYALGVAEADHPLNFNDANKYSHPVVAKNLGDNPEEQRYQFTSSLANFSNWRYTLDKPADNWASADAKDADWKTGDKGFGNRVIKGSTVINPQTTWDSNDIWIRKRFKMSWSPTNNLQLLINHAGPTEVLLDGNVIYKGTTANYTTIDLDAKTIEALRTGEHILAVHSQHGRGANVDLDLLDNLKQPGDDVLYNPGQPTFVKGPNGFEWWLVYFGIKNGGRKGQFVNRVLFNDHELTVDGMTGNKTPGYHPDPSAPVFGDIFEDANRSVLNSKWSLKSGKWNVNEGELNLEGGATKAVALINSHPSNNYLFKAGVKPVNGANCGIIAYYDSPGNYLEIGLDKAKNAWYTKLVQSGKETIAFNKLSPTFNFNVYHSLAVYKNGKRVDVLIDDNPAPGNSKVNTTFVKAGLPAVFSLTGKASFDGVIYTPGWDEYNTNITAWGNAADGRKATGKWAVNNTGIDFSKGNYNVFKGDLLNQYEFGTQIYLNNTAEQIKQGAAGIYPVYTDQNNYLKAVIDQTGNKLVVSGKLNSAAITEIAIPLKRTLVNYPNIIYRDRLAKTYTLKKNTLLSGLQIVKSIYSKEDMSANLFDTLSVEYQHNNEWYPLKTKVSATGVEAIDKVGFNTVTADAIRLTKNGGDFNVPVYKLYTEEESTSNYNLRAVKLKDKVILFLDGKQVAEVKGEWPASQVGLLGIDMAASYNGILLFEK